MPPSLRHSLHALTRRRCRAVVAPALAVAGATIVVGCGASGPDASAVQTYRAIVDRDSQLLWTDVDHVGRSCAYITAGDGVCQSDVAAVKRQAQAMLTDLKATRVPASIADADREYRDGLEMFITETNDLLTYVTTGSGEAHDRVLADAKTADEKFSAADADLAKAL